MGFVDTSDNPKMRTFYNVIHAVGKNCPNSPDDTKLVQYMLLKIYEKVASDGFAKPKGEMKVDGKCGPVTQNWIQKFQLDVASVNPGNIMVDSRADRIRDKITFRGDFSKKYYTLYYLNHFLAKKNPQAFVNLPNSVPLQNVNSVPPPSWDVVEEIQTVPTTGGA